MSRPGDALRKVAERAGTRGGRAAASAIALEGEREMKRLLGRRSHKRGTPTPSRPGQPPALVSGTLRRSVIVDRPRLVGPFRWRARVGPTVVYARIQDKGGVAGRNHTVRLPARPYARPTSEALQASGVLSARAAQAFYREVFGG